MTDGLGNSVVVMRPFVFGLRRHAAGERVAGGHTRGARVGQSGT